MTLTPCQTDFFAPPAVADVHPSRLPVFRSYAPAVVRAERQDPVAIGQSQLLLVWCPDEWLASGPPGQNGQQKQRITVTPHLALPPAHLGGPIRARVQALGLDASEYGSAGRPPTPFPDPAAQHQPPILGRE